MDSDAPPSAGFYNFLGWFETNKKRVAIGAGVVLFVGIVAGIWAWRSSERQIEAEEALSLVRMPANPLESPAPGTADALAKVAEEYPKTQAAGKALLRSGAVYFGEANYAKAREQFEKYMREFGETPWVPEAVFGVAASFDAENKTAEAINKYNDFLKSYSSDPAADQARLNLARLYEHTKQPALALEVLTKMANAQPGTPPPAEVQEKLRELYTKYPSLIASNPAPARPQMMPSIAPQVSPAPASTSGAPRILLNPGQPTPTPGK
ncbi:MAG TPA: tetratricopeptide repeat protein [Candidatus Limnocylindria bacterium]|nr:tetratricopeptide repeat protein [Candidatus Limnocylindria bacterium]